MQIILTIFFYLKWEKVQQSLPPTNSSMRSLPSQDSKGTKLIVTAVAKVSWPYVILIGLMSTSYSVIPSHPLAPHDLVAHAFFAFFFRLYCRMKESPCRSFLQDVCAEFSREFLRCNPVTTYCIARISLRFLSSFSFYRMQFGFNAGNFLQELMLHPMLRYYDS